MACLQLYFCTVTSVNQCSRLCFCRLHTEARSYRSRHTLVPVHNLSHITHTVNICHLLNNLLTFRDEERNNPRILKPYRPWWRADPTVLQVSSAMKIAQLREEATRRGIHSEHMKKGEILMALKDLVEKYSLSGETTTK